MNLVSLEFELNLSLWSIGLLDQDNASGKSINFAVYM